MLTLKLHPVGDINDFLFCLGGVYKSVTLFVLEYVTVPHSLSHLYLKAYLFLFFFRNKSVVKQLESKIAGLENYKKQLEVSETAIGQQKKQRSDHKKLTIF